MYFSGVLKAVTGILKWDIQIEGFSIKRLIRIAPSIYFYRAMIQRLTNARRGRKPSGITNETKHVVRLLLNSGEVLSPHHLHSFLPSSEHRIPLRHLVGRSRLLWWMREAFPEDWYRRKSVPKRPSLASMSEHRSRVARFLFVGSLAYPILLFDCLINNLSQLKNYYCVLRHRYFF